MPRAFAFIRRVSRQPEDSVSLRLVVLAITMVSVAAVALVGATDPGTGLGSLILVPIASWLSHRRRRASNSLLKAMLALGLAAALLGFLLGSRWARCSYGSRCCTASTCPGGGTCRSRSSPAWR